MYYSRGHVYSLELQKLTIIHLINHLRKFD